jgi:hypothetical protein
VGGRVIVPGFNDSHYHSVSYRIDREVVQFGGGEAVQQLKQESGKGLSVGGVKLPLALAELGLIDVCRLEAREPAGVQLGGGGDAV